jgi:predicted enzyme related to lactoylglutathione lyase
MLHRRGHPDRAMRGHNPEAARCAHGHHTAGSVNELVLVVRVRRNNSRRRQIHRESSQEGSRLFFLSMARFRHGLALYRKPSARTTFMLSVDEKKRPAKTITAGVNNITHFAITAADVPRARQFYADVFGWKFEPWGPPSYFRIATGDEKNPGIPGALQERQKTAPAATRHGFECSISVADIDAAISAIEDSGGKIVLPKWNIPGVGTLVKFEDTEGNIATAIEYEQPPDS